MSYPAFWGPVTSSVDWCESNYDHSRYVCEWFNTLSSVAMVLVGAVGFWWHRRVLERRFLLAFLLVAVVGLGSVAFHATLRFEFQMLDEVPMLYVALVMVYAVLENRPEPRFGRRLPLLLMTWGVVVTALSTLSRGRTQFFVFQTSFGTLECFALYRAYRLYRRSSAAVVGGLFRTGMTLYLVAIALWFTDLRACSALNRLPGLPNPQFHAWWHVLVACGLYLLIVMIAFDRQETLGHAPSLRGLKLVTARRRGALAP